MKRIVEKIIISIVGVYNFRAILSKITGKNVHNYHEGEWIYRLFREDSKKGIMIDVGAHHGESFAPYISLGWRVYAFEPDPNNYKQIPRSKKLSLYNFAISDHEDESVSFFASHESSGISSLSAFRGSHKEITKVGVTSLRKIIESEQISTIDYLKIDAEGHDLFCLKGFPFEKIRPEVILCEFEDEKTRPLGYSYEDLGSFLREKGYHVLLSEWEPITQYGIKHKWRAIRDFPLRLDNEQAWGNFVAVKSAEKLNRLRDIIDNCID